MPLALLLNLALGLAFAWAGRDRLRADGPFAPPAFLLVVTHVGLVTAPVTLYFYVAHADWSWLYVVRPSHVPALAIIPMVVLHGLFVLGGWYAGGLLVRYDRVKWLLYAVAGTTLAFTIAVLIASPRLLAAGTYAGYHAGAKRNLMGVELGWALLVSVAASTGAAGYVFVELMRDSRRVRAR